MDEALDSSFEVKTYKRHDYLTLSNNKACSETSSSTSGVPAVPSSIEGVTVVGADSLPTSPTVSSGNESLSFSVTPDSEEVVHLRGELFYP